MALRILPIVRRKTGELPKMRGWKECVRSLARSTEKSGPRVGCLQGIHRSTTAAGGRGEEDAGSSGHSVLDGFSRQEDGERGPRGRKRPQVRTRFQISSWSRCLSILVCGFVVGQVACSAGAGGTDAPILLRGSSTLEPMAEAWASAYGQRPEASPLDVSATGTGDGIRDLLAGRADIAMASRPINEEEWATGRSKGLVIRETIVARMGIAVIVNRGNPVESISMRDLAEVFSGGSRTWRTLGGPNEPIIIVRKESGWSPDFFRGRVMGDREFAGDSVIVDSKDAVVAEVANRPWSIGVTGMPEAMPFLDRVSLIRMAGESPVEDSTFALSRPLFFITVGESPRVQRFLDFVVGEEAQDMIPITGLYPAKQVDPMSADS